MVDDVMDVSTLPLEDDETFEKLIQMCIRDSHRLADDKAVIDYGFHGTVQHVNDQILDELESMVEDGVPSVKVYLTYGFKINDLSLIHIWREDYDEIEPGHRHISQLYGLYPGNEISVEKTPNWLRQQK